MHLHELHPAPGSRKRPKRIGRGIGSGHGKTATKGHKGLLARSGGGKRPGFEGGQMPLKRRVPKRGFTNIFRKEWSIVNLRDLERLEGVQDVTPAVLIQSGLVPAHGSRIKVLAEGVLSRPLHVQAHRFSESAAAKIQAAGGRVEVLGGA
ncbi:MAG: 50S ribosomal protein L15 [Nitrospirae bacterium]|nr:MAG: 50S ribosomal protein L15 [Nitrospirota bacterium]